MLSSTVIQFPGLGLTLDPPSSIELFGLSIHYYGVIIAFGMLLAVAYCWKRARQFGVKEDDLTDGILWIVPVAILCARMYYVAFKWEDYADDPITMLYIWNGGLAIYGGIIGAVICAVIHCKIKKIKFAAVMDLVVLGLLIGQLVGRWGNFMNREAYGAEITGDFFLRMGLMKTAEGALSSTMHYFHPTFLYESAWNFVGLILLHFLSKRRKYDGQIALGYMAWYGLGRAMIEGLRTDSLWWGPFRVSQLVAAVTCFVAVVALAILSFRRHDPEKLYVNQVAALKAQEEAEEKTEDSEETVEVETADDADAPVDAPAEVPAETPEETPEE